MKKHLERLAAVGGRRSAAREGRGMTLKWRGQGQTQSSGISLGRRFEKAGLACPTQTSPVQFFQKNDNNNNNPVDLVCFFSPSILPAMAG